MTSDSLKFAHIDWQFYYIPLDLWKKKIDLFIAKQKLEHFLAIS